MTPYISTRGGIAAADFETAVLQGFAADGGLFVPETIPRISEEQLQGWSKLSFADLARISPPGVRLAYGSGPHRTEQFL